MRYKNFWYEGMHYSQAAQYTGGIGFSAGNFSLQFEDDYPFGDQHDRYRTTRIMASYKLSSQTSLAAGLNFFTGDPVKPAKNNTYVDETPFTFRNGIISAGIINKGQAYLLGWDSEGIRSLQNKFHDAMGKVPIKMAIRFWFSTFSS